MLKWLRGDPQRSNDTKTLSGVVNGLQEQYDQILSPLEKLCDYALFSKREALTDADFAARPMVLFLGQYSTGKTTLIRHLLGREYPGLRIGPEPTTDKFVAVTHHASEDDSVIPGHTAVSDASMPFTQLGSFGDGFLSRFEVVQVQSPVLEGVTLIDTPGVLAGEKQRLNRSYDFEAVSKWFADRVDLIILLFDVSKLDISDEFRRVIEAIHGNEHKIRIILNKADSVTTPQLLRVYGALTWSLGKIIVTPEQSRVFIGSFWKEELKNKELKRTFELEENDLYVQLAQLPRGAAVAKLNDLIKRARSVKIHLYLLDRLRLKFRTFWFKGKAQSELIASLDEIYQEISEETKVPLKDFPDRQRMQEQLASYDFSKLSKLEAFRPEALEQMLNTDLPSLLNLIPQERHIHSSDISIASLQRQHAARSRSRSRSREPRGNAARSSRSGSDDGLGKGAQTGSEQK